MFWPFRRSPRWPAGLPRLYPELDAAALCRFLTPEEQARIAGLPRVLVLPFCSREDARDDLCFGAGVAALLRRDLMLVRDLSVHGQEDTPRLTCEVAPRVAQAEGGARVLSGRAWRQASGFRLALSVHADGRAPQEAVVEEPTLEAFLLAAAERATALLGGTADAEVRRRWRVGRPRGAEGLVRLGALALVPPPDSPDAADVLALREAEPELGVAAEFLDDERPRAREVLLAAREADPFDAQLCFRLFLNLWKGTGASQPEAVQFLRRAIELSPGHGKAHMCAPHAAERPEEMVGHSELGYALLPGNSFAVNNLILYLCRAGAPVERLVQLSIEVIEADPEDPSGYLQAVHNLQRAGRPDQALLFAQRLRALYGPPMPERTRYCLEQNPERKERLRRGTYDPVAEADALVASLTRAARAKGLPAGEAAARGRRAGGTARSK
jgi:hypothetical protein